MRLAAIGDNCVDFYEKQGWAYPGGNAVNVAVYGRQLGMDAAFFMPKKLWRTVPGSEP